MLQMISYSISLSKRPKIIIGSNIEGMISHNNYTVLTAMDVL